MDAAVVETLAGNVVAGTKALGACAAGDSEGFAAAGSV
jgi:hypothetical protein